MSRPTRSAQQKKLQRTDKARKRGKQKKEWYTKEERGNSRKPERVEKTCSRDERSGRATWQSKPGQIEEQKAVGDTG